MPVAVLLIATVVAGCGGDEAPEAGPTATTAAVPDCTPLEPGRNDRFLLCRRSGPRDRGSFVFRGRGRIAIEYPNTGPAGHWSGGFLSPDGRTLLLQWTAECEVPFAFFVPARGGTPRLVFGGRRLEDAQPAIGHGWTLNGEAIVEAMPTCGAARPNRTSEVWLVTPGGEKRRLSAP